MSFWDGDFGGVAPLGAPFSAVNTAASSSITSWYLNGQPYVQCRCGTVHTGQYAIEDAAHHECLHDVPLYDYGGDWWRQAPEQWDEATRKAVPDYEVRLFRAWQRLRNVMTRSSSEARSRADAPRPLSSETPPGAPETGVPADGGAA